MNGMSGMELMESEFNARLKVLPGVQAGLSNPASLLATCKALGKNKAAVWTAAGSAMRQAKVFPEGHPSRERAFDLADALYFYHDHLEEVERYEGEIRAAKEPPRFQLV